MQMIFGSSKAPVADIDVLNLSGTSESPTTKTLQVIGDDRTGAVTWLIGCIDVGGYPSIVSGEIQSSGVADGGAESFTSVDVSTDWVIPKGFDVTYYALATLDSGSSPTSGSGVGTWLSLVPDGANRSWTWNKVGLGVFRGTLKLEIATDALGADIVATGYYKADIEIIP